MMRVTLSKKSLRPLCALLVALTPLAGCAHTRPPPAAQPPPPPRDMSALSAHDARFLSEAIAYDLMHSPWSNAWSSAHEEPAEVVLGRMPHAVAPSGTPFAAEAMTQSLAQALRNAGGVVVVEDAAGAPWTLTIAAQHVDAALENETARRYAITASLRPTQHAVVAWSKTYPLIKRLNEVPHVPIIQ